MTISWHITALQVSLATGPRRGRFARWLIRQRNRFIPWFMWSY